MWQRSALLEANYVRLFVQVLGVADPTVSLDGISQDLKKPSPILVVKEDNLPCIATAANNGMSCRATPSYSGFLSSRQQTFVLDPECSCHTTTLARVEVKAKNKDATPSPLNEVGDYVGLLHSTISMIAKRVNEAKKS